jgi:hypothetical protein
MGEEKVYITPAASLRDPCRRGYNPPGGPCGTNTNRSDFYCDVACLECLKWDIINDRWFNDDEKKRIKHAEALIPDILSIQKIQRIAVNNQKLMQNVNTLIDQCRLGGRIPYATFEPHLFFQ